METFRALTVYCIVFQQLTTDCMHIMPFDPIIRWRIRSKSTYSTAYAWLQLWLEWPSPDLRKHLRLGARVSIGKKHPRLFALTPGESLIAWSPLGSKDIPLVLLIISKWRAWLWLLAIHDTHCLVHFLLFRHPVRGYCNAEFRETDNSSKPLVQTW